MKDPSEQWSCAACDFRLWIPVHAPGLTTARVGLYDDGRFPGRCIVVLEEHHEHLDALPPEALAALWSDVARVGGAVRAVTGAVRVNYAVLGNAARHLHVHVIPRQPSAEELPTRPPWNDPRPLMGLRPGAVEELRSALGTRLV